MSVSTVILSAAATLLAVLYLRRVLRFLRDVLHMKRVTKDVPSPPSLPVLGHVLQLSGDTHDLYYKLYKLCQDYGPVFKVWLGPTLAIVVQDADDIEHVMLHPSLQDKSSLYRFFEEIVGQGLLVLNGKDHRRHRKAISPFLNMDILQDFVESFDEEGRKMADHLCTLADSGEEFDPKMPAGHCSNKSVCKTVFSLGESNEKIDRNEFVRCLNYAQELIMYRVWNPWFANDWTFMLSSMYDKYWDGVNKVESFVRNVVNVKIAEKEKQGMEKTPPKRRRAFVDYLLSSEEEVVLNKEELYEECKLLTVVASNSSKDVLTFCSLVLAIRPDIQQKLQQEVDDIFGGDLNRPVLPSDLPHLQYTERFVKETMRYFTPVPLFVRACNEDVKLPSGYVAPKGCHIAFFMPPVHHNAKYFPDPMKFDPDRFLPENSRGRHPFCYLPFSAGVRNCIGSRYAMMLQKTVLANLVRRVNFIPGSNTAKRLQDVKLKVDVGLGVWEGSEIRVERRFPATAAR